MKKIKSIHWILAAAAILVFAGFVNAAPIIAPTGTVASSSYASAVPANVINAASLNIDNELKVQNVWGNWLFNAMVSGNGGFNNYHWIYIDLGKNYDLDEIRIWNYFDDYTGFDVTTRGLKDFTLYVAGDGATLPASGTVLLSPFAGPDGWTYKLGTGGEPNIILAKAPVATVPIGPTDTFVVAGTNVVRYIGIDVGANNWAGGGGNLGGFAHIQVTGTESPSPIVVTGEPNGLTVSAGSPAVFTVAASGYTSATWKKNNVVVSNGPTGSGATISGATTNELTITNVQMADEGNYGCELAASVYKATTTPVQLLTKRIISHWPLDSDANDIVGPWNGIAKTELYFTSGRVGTGALDYDSLVVIPGSESYFNFYTRGFTCTFWFKHDSSMAYKTPVSKFDWSNSKGFHTFIDTNPSTFVTSVEGTGLTAEGGIVPGQWNFVATTYDLATTTLKLYVNGQFYARWHAFYPSQGASTAKVSIGGVDPYTFPGQVDDVKIYSYAVDGQSIVQEYVNGTGNSKCFCSDWDILPVGSDCKVDFVDFARFAGDYWFDGSEWNMLDLSDFASQWLKNSVTLTPQ